MIADAAECPACGDCAQPEQDGDLIYHACGCGHEFGYRRLPQQESTCQIGVPEDVRRQASLVIADTAMPVFLGSIGRRPE